MLLALLAACLLAAPAGAAPPRLGVPPSRAAAPPPRLGYLSSRSRVADGGRGLLGRCTEQWRDATLDHFGFTHKYEGATFAQRYYVCADEWGGPGHPIFFYAGNEADVTLYLNATGLMWESAPAFRAALVFAEHRFYGRSKPRSPRWADAHLRFLTAEQAMADYAELVAELRAGVGGLPGGAPTPSSAVIAFGGSYGGMLATWLRLKYASAFDGAIAASAPIWTFEGESPPVDPGAFAAIVTRDATPAAGAPPGCDAAVRRAFAALIGVPARGARAARAARAALRLCDDVPLATPDDVAAVADWLSGAFDSMAMGNFPYASSYLLNGDAELPPWPMRAACGALASAGARGGGGGDDDGAASLAALGDAVSIYFNASGGAGACYGGGGSGSAATDDDGRLWGYQYCTEMFMPMSKDGVRDMFYDQPWDADAAAAACAAAWGVTPRRLWADVEFGGRRIGAITNVVWTNGGYDPWSGGGVLADVGPTAVALTIPEGGHHLDLMFAHAADPPSVVAVREEQRRHIARWVQEKRAAVEAGDGAGGKAVV